MILPKIFYVADLDEFGWTVYLTDIRNDDIRLRCDVGREGTVNNVFLHGTAVGPSVSIYSSIGRTIPW